MADKVTREAAATFYEGGRLYANGDRIELNLDDARLMDDAGLLKPKKKEKAEKTKQDKPERTQQVEAESPVEGRSTKKRQTKGS